MRADLGPKAIGAGETGFSGLPDKTKNPEAGIFVESGLAPTKRGA